MSDFLYETVFYILLQFIVAIDKDPVGIFPAHQLASNKWNDSAAMLGKTFDMLIHFRIVQKSFTQTGKLTLKIAWR